MTRFPVPAALGMHAGPLCEIAGPSNSNVSTNKLFLYFPERYPYVGRCSNRRIVEARRRHILDVLQRHARMLTSHTDVLVVTWLLCQCPWWCWCQHITDAMPQMPHMLCMWCPMYRMLTRSFQHQCQRPPLVSNCALKDWGACIYWLITMATIQQPWL